MSLETTIARLEKKVDALAKPKPFWVGPEVIKEMTGYDKNGMTRLRKNNPDLWRLTTNGGYLYNINAIPDSIKIKK